ncbi:high affinity nerve growth factor receptor, partial [Puccinia sorghi]
TVHTAQSLCILHSHCAYCTVTVHTAQSLCILHSHCAYCTVTVHTAQSLCILHSHCAYCTVTVPNNIHMQTCGVWMEAWLEHAACQLQAVEQFFLVFNHVCSSFSPMWCKKKCATVHLLVHTTFNKNLLLMHKTQPKKVLQYLNENFTHALSSTFMKQSFQEWNNNPSLENI